MRSLGIFALQGGEVQGKIDNHFPLKYRTRRASFDYVVC
jgi:hypothetical protein